MENSNHRICGFAAGCYWGVEHAFKMLEGVLKTEVGFQGGHIENPSYKEVCQTDTGHAEVVRVTYDAEKISLSRLLDAFFFMHDPTQLNKQGPDVGSQYRSALFPESPWDQEDVAIIKEAIEKRRDQYSSPIVTTIEENQIFYSAEDSHQDYLVNNPGGYCHIGLDTFAKLKQGLF